STLPTTSTGGTTRTTSRKASAAAAAWCDVDQRDLNARFAAWDIGKHIDTDATCIGDDGDYGGAGGRALQLHPRGLAHPVHLEDVPGRQPRQPCPHRRQARVRGSYPGRARSV